MLTDSGTKNKIFRARHIVLMRLLAIVACLVAGIAPRAHADEPVLLVIGDSLSAGYGISSEQGWVHLLQQRLVAEQHRYKVVNASISGDTSRGGSARLGLLLDRFDVAIAVVELGGNDGLRGLNLAETRKYLDDIVSRLQESGAKVLLAGMQIPPNLGPQYTNAFKNLYPSIAEAREIALVPFFLEGVATRPELMQRDGIHPVATAQPRLLDNVWPYLKPLL